MQAKTFVPVGREKSTKAPPVGQPPDAMESNLLANMELGVHDPHQRSTSDQARPSSACMTGGAARCCHARGTDQWLGRDLLANMELGVHSPPAQHLRPGAPWLCLHDAGALPLPPLIMSR